MHDQGQGFCPLGKGASYPQEIGLGHTSSKVVGREELVNYV